MKRWLVLILIAAALLRFGYQEGMLAFGGSFHNGSDSGKYLTIADTIYDTGTFGRASESGVDPELNRMPMYPYFLAGVFSLFGKGNLHAVVLVQILLDIGTIVGLALAAAAIDRRLVLPSAAVAAFIPNFLVHASTILTEVLFLFFFVWGVCASLWALKSRNSAWLLAAAGACFGLALLTRSIMMFFPAFLFVTLLVTLPGKIFTQIHRRLLLAVLPAAVMLAFVAPRIMENYRNFGHAILTNQSGAHLLKWVYPCLRTPWSCSSIGEAWKENEPLVQQRLAVMPESERNNPAIIDFVRRQVAVERIHELGLQQIVIGMTIGAFKNLIQTGFYETLTQFRQPATFFSAMAGSTVGERFSNFIVTNRTNVFMALWAISQAALLLSRAVQLFGFGVRLTDAASRPAVLFLGMTVVYFLAINGPVGDPKYRIPIEPALLIFFSMGLCTLVDWVRARRMSSFTPRAAS